MAALFWLSAGLQAAQLPPAKTPTVPVISIPRLTHPPTIEDFLEMKPSDRLEGEMASIEGLIQREPSDGQPETQRTVVYFGYDDKNLYVVFVCFDSEPEKIRARRVSRENIIDDDVVELMLDTFHDQRRAYAFLTNPLGIQLDGLFNEGGSLGANIRSNSDESITNFDFSFDTIWDSEGRLTPQGYVVWMAIPFKSLRFPASPQQTWGIIFHRTVRRSNERAFWPQVTTRIEGRMNQAATAQGLENISPGRNIQLIPYAAFRSFRALDTRDRANPHFTSDAADPDGGLDAKFIFKDSVVLDATVNPDFAQVESDEPQVTVNQRFEVFFPEKRPFFLENSGYFQTPIDLLFTRRIADPQFGARLTGKLGPYQLGAFLIDDQAPGKAVPDSDPLHGQRALYAITRGSFDLFRQSTLGFIITDREFEQTYNRIVGADARLKLGENWVVRAQAVTSWTRCLPTARRQALRFGTLVDRCFFNDPERLAGPAYDVAVRRSGRSLRGTFEYNDRGRGFRTAPGFLRRPDVRRLAPDLRYFFYPKSKIVLFWWPAVSATRVYDHSGTRLDWTLNPSLNVVMPGQTSFSVFYNVGRERLRPQDFSGLTANLDLPLTGYGATFATGYVPQVTVSGHIGLGRSGNFAPPSGQVPFVADETSASLNLTLSPRTALRVDNTYLFFRLQERADGHSVFNNHILRSRWNYQFTRELSLRVILQYDATLSNETFSSLPTRKNFNADFLVTYLLHPGTALYVGYNGNEQNIDLVPSATGTDIVFRRHQFINDARQFFVKFSYLYRF